MGKSWEGLEKQLTATCCRSQGKLGSRRQSPGSHSRPPVLVPPGLTPYLSQERSWCICSDRSPVRASSEWESRWPPGPLQGQSPETEPQYHGTRDMADLRRGSSSGGESEPLRQAGLGWTVLRFDKALFLGIKYTFTVKQTQSGKNERREMKTRRPADQGPQTSSVDILGFLAGAPQLCRQHGNGWVSTNLCLQKQVEAGSGPWPQFHRPCPGVAPAAEPGAPGPL